MASPPSSAPPDKPAHDVVAGAMARAASQSTIHPLDTMKVRMQTGAMQGAAKGAALSLNAAAREVASLYRGVVSAATGAGVIIGAYFAFYSTTKRFLRQRTTMGEGQMAFVSGGVAAVGSGVVKVPIAVCIRSVQAGVYPNVVAAARSITGAAGVPGLFTVRPRALIAGPRGAAASVPARGQAGARCACGLWWPSALRSACPLCPPALTRPLADWNQHALSHRPGRAPTRAPLVQGFVPTIMEDVPDMAVKFAVYETLRCVHARLTDGRRVRARPCVCVCLETALAHSRRPPARPAPPLWTSPCTHAHPSPA